MLTHTAQTVDRVA